MTFHVFKTKISICITLFPILYVKAIFKSLNFSISISTGTGFSFPCSCLCHRIARWRIWALPIEKVKLWLSYQYYRSGFFRKIESYLFFHFVSLWSVFTFEENSGVCEHCQTQIFGTRLSFTRKPVHLSDR